MSPPMRPATLTVLLIVLSAMSGPVHAFEIDATGIVTRVVDGDTFHTSQDTIRLADVNTPEVGQPGYNEATGAISAMVGGQQVFLDIDDVYQTDRYGRLVCVVYVSHNTTHLANVNKLLWQGGYALLDDYDNEFNPYTWTTYMYSPEGSRTSPQTGPAPDLSMVILVLAAMVIVIAVVAIILRSGRRRVARKS